jgi:hypothetical protein
VGARSPEIADHAPRPTDDRAATRTRKVESGDTSVKVYDSAVETPSLIVDHDAPPSVDLWMT